MALPGRGKSAVQLSQPSAPGSVADDDQHICTLPSSFYGTNYGRSEFCYMTAVRPAHSKRVGPPLVIRRALRQLLHIMRQGVIVSVYEEGF